MDKTWLAMGSISMFLAVAAGAFGAHALKARLTPEMREIYEVAVRYHVYHALAMLFVSVAAARPGGAIFQIAGIAFLLGTVLFSGSLYVMAVTENKALGMITPLGGVLFLIGWLALLWSAIVR